MLRRSAQFRIEGPHPPTDPQERDRIRRSGDRHTLGSIIWLAMLRFVAVVFVAWYLREPFSNYYTEWWMVTVAAIYGVAIYPAKIQYDYFKRTSKRLMEQTLCSSCRHFNPEGLHCMQLDEHITEYYLPCDGEGWEPKSFEDI